MARAFSECVKNPDTAMIPMEYEEFLMRDILHYSREEFEALGFESYLHALNYAWTTYALRRSDLPYRSGGKGDSSNAPLPLGAKRKKFLGWHYEHPDIKKWIAEADQHIPKYVKKGEKK